MTAQTVREHGLDSDHDLWIVSLDLLSVNGAVQHAVHPDRMGWDAVGYYQAAEMLALNTPRALLMTATPHRGKEWLFRALLHLVDPEVFPTVESHREPSRNVKPGRVQFLRRMKENLVDFDGTMAKLIKGRHAENQPVRLSPVEAEFYIEALDMVERYCPAIAVPLGRWSTASARRRRCTRSRRRLSVGVTAWARRCPQPPQSRLTLEATTPQPPMRPASCTKAPSRPRPRSARSTRRSPGSGC